MTDANTRPGVAGCARHLDAAVEVLGVARDEPRAAGMEGEAESVTTLLAEMGCELDTAAALAEARNRNLRRLREFRDGRDLDGETDGGSGCGSFSHPSENCSGEG